MSEYKFDFSDVDEMTVKAERKGDAVVQVLSALERQLRQGQIPNEVTMKTYDVTAMATGCIYRVAGTCKSDAEDNLRKHIKRERNSIKEDLPMGSDGFTLLTDLNTACEAEKEVEGDWDIGPGGKRDY